MLSYKEEEVLNCVQRRWVKTWTNIVDLYASKYIIKIKLVTIKKILYLRYFKGDNKIDRSAIS